MSGTEGEIRHRLFVVVRSHTSHAQVGSALFTMHRHFSLLILRAATSVATFFSGMVIHYEELRSEQLGSSILKWQATSFMVSKDSMDELQLLYFVVWFSANQPCQSMIMRLPMRVIVLHDFLVLECLQGGEPGC
jgi:hypothetical protein